MQHADSVKKESKLYCVIEKNIDRLRFLQLGEEKSTAHSDAKESISKLDNKLQPMKNLTIDALESRFNRHNVHLNIKFVIKL